MNIFCIMIILNFLSISNFQNEKVRGNYKFEVGKISRYYNAKIQLKDSIFILTFSNARKKIGKINCHSTRTSFNIDVNSIIDFRTSDLRKDTIEFTIHGKKSPIPNYIDKSIDVGYLIRTK